MKAQFERIQHPDDASWRFFLRELDTLPFEWHYHPEYELTLTVNSQGERYIGDHIEAYQSGDLVLLGPNLPHSWASQTPGQAGPHRVYVLWFHQAWVDGLARQFPEFASLAPWLDRSRRGLAWSHKLASDLEPLFEQLPGASAARRLTLLLDILIALQEEAPRTLASARFHGETLAEPAQRELSPILDSLHRDFREPLRVPDLARNHHMSVSTMNRVFRRQMNQSLHQYLTHIRLGHACADLIRTERPVSLVAEQSGFANLSNFNRLFKQYKGVTPRQFRRKFQQAVVHGRPSMLAGSVDNS
ncbi:AraC family transcriptional regulator [Saccharospirillum sp.]|uniref:AraC family transcriptional regulator n=2 Tax=Saccharospirillum sp. TaxID=2033801 RepID=UPI0032971197